MRLEDVVDPAKHTVRLLPGYATDTTDTVLVGGTAIPAFWMAHIDAQQFDPIWVLIADRPDATSIGVVVGVNGTAMLSLAKPLYGTVTAAPIGSDTITVSTTVGVFDAAFPASYAPAVSDQVRLLWQDDNAWVLGKSAKVPAPAAKKPANQAPRVPKPPGGSGSGTDTFTASDSATWSSGTGSWNSYFGKDVYQGSYSGVGANRGAWFYHNKPTKLKGKTAVKVELWVPKRARAGSYNSSVGMQLYLHYSARRPVGDVDRGSHETITIPKGFSGGWKTLPTSWGAPLIEGKGIGIAGGSYAGFEGVGKSSKSGQIRITWEG